jgi:hypothetical protein
MGADRFDLNSSSAASNLDLWLAPCEGFRVTSPEGRVGTLVDVFYEGDRPRLLAVRSGRLGRRLDLYPVAEITEVRFEERRVLLRRFPQRLERRAAALAARGLHRLPNRTAPAPRPGAFFGSVRRVKPS